MEGREEKRINGGGGRVVVMECKREGLIGDGGKIHYIVYIKY